MRARSVLRSGAVQRELDTELRHHLHQAIDEYLAAGMTASAARAAALRDIGGLDQAAEACRDTWRVALVRDLARDLRYAARTLRANPVFTTVAMLTLALGVGATTAIFSVVDGVILRPLAYPEASRILSVGTRMLETGREFPRLAGADLLDLRAEHSLFDAFSAYWGGDIGVQAGAAGEFAGTFWVEPSFFRVFGIRPIRGRTFTPPDGERDAVVSLGFAERVFGSADRAIGGHLSVEGQVYEIVGVMPRDFEAPQKAEVWLPMPWPLARLARERTAFNVQAAALMKRGIDRRQVQAGLDTLAARLAASFPASNRGRGFSAVPWHDRLTSRVRATLIVLLGAVGLVLVIACLNVANLLLARSAGRTHEIALRAALGASRRRILRQLLAESLLLAFCGGLLGVVLAVGVTRALVLLAPESLPRVNEVVVDWRVLAFAAACSVLASLTSGLAPAWTAARRDVNVGLRQSTGRGVTGGPASRMRGAFVVVEVALAFALSVGAVLLVRSFSALTAEDPGFRSDSVLVMYAHRPASSVQEYRDVARFFSTLGAQLSTIPAVTRAAAVMGLPTGRYGSTGTYEIEGRAAPASSAERPDAGFRLASPGYFATLGVPLLRGRDFDARDRHDTAFVAIVSRTLVERQFRGEDPLGRRIRCGLDAPDTWMTIVGIVGDVRHESPGAEPRAEIYMPLTQHPFHANEVQVVMRTTAAPDGVAEAVRGRMRSLAPGTAVAFTTLDAMVAASVSTHRFRALLFSCFAGLALLLAIAGVYGVLAFSTAQRTAEFGLRVALGAGWREVFGDVVRRAVGLGTPGLVLGLVLTVAGSQLLDGMRYGPKDADAVVYGIVAGLIGIAVAAASAVPAWRAATVDPVTALRQE